jgi:hypothetical protein
VRDQRRYHRHVISDGNSASFSDIVGVSNARSAHDAITEPHENTYSSRSACFQRNNFVVMLLTHSLS